MPRKDAAAYALTEKGKAAKERARIKWTAKRKIDNYRPKFSFKVLTTTMQSWGKL